MMRFVLPERTLIKRMAACAAVLLVLSWVGEARAQWSTKWLAVGELHHPYLSGGSEPENLIPDSYLIYPGIQPGSANNHWKGLWISAENWTGPDGENWDVRTSHIGPRILGIGEVFDLQHVMVARFEPPVVTVDGNNTFLRPLIVEEVDPELDPAQMVHSVFNTSVGVQVEKRAMQFSNEYHDNYHIIEYIFTNTGNIDDDEEIEAAQDLEDVYFTFLERPKINAPSGAWDNSSGGMAWGQHVMNDANWPGGPMDYGVDFRAQWSWIGRIPGQESFNTLGNPMWFNHQWNAVPDDTLGRLGGATMTGQVALHADAISHAPPEEGYNAILDTETVPDHLEYGVADDPAQPSTMTYLESDWSDITTGNDHTNLSKMLFERQYIERGARGNPINIAPEGADPRTWPTHAYMVEPTGDFVNQNTDPSLGRAGGWGFVNAYGPYDIPVGEQVKIVMAEGVAGLSERAAYVIGREYKLSGADDALEIPFDADNDGTIEDDERLTKNEWALTARDSLFQMFERARSNYRAGYNIPTAPMPPSRFGVTSGIDQIVLEWDVYPEAGDPPNGWRIFRAQKNYWGIVTALEVGADGLAVPDSARAYTCIAGCENTPPLPGSARSYEDADVERGSQYFYYIQAVGDVNMDDTGNTPTGAQLASNRYYTQTYEPAVLKRAPATDLSEVRVVPNPYNLQASTEVRFDVEEQISFFGLPGIAEIRIYTELGELIETIQHTDQSGDDTWNLTTSSRQPVVSGVYIAVIENQDPDSPSFGEQVIRKFIIIR